jgi:hypothetical protein
MADRHKADRHLHDPVGFRPPEGDRTWLWDHAEQTGQSRGQVLSKALAAYRAEWEAAADDGQPPMASAINKALGGQLA